MHPITKIQTTIAFKKRVPDSREIVWERQCKYESGTLGDFSDWLTASLDDKKALGPFSSFPRSEFWGYCSYKNLLELFRDDPRLFSAVQWKRFGIDLDGEASTFWFGSEGSSTQCHYDTYVKLFVL